jgi:hypothetical protein
MDGPIKCSSLTLESEKHLKGQCLRGIYKALEGKNDQQSKYENVESMAMGKPKEAKDEPIYTGTQIAYRKTEM